MNSQSLLNVVINAIKMRFMAITTRLRMWLNPSFIRTRIFGRIRTFFTNLFNVKPRNKNDYYAMFGYLVSKRLAFAIVIVVGTVSLCYLAMTHSDIMTRSNRGGIKTYAYNSIPLRFAKGEVYITARKGYTAYQGQVSKGAANGRGILYDEDGHTVYEGYFENNKYEGSGKTYYPNGAATYVGNFSKNLYEGLGKLYRENGSIHYNGEFSQGLMEGEGKLYNEGSTQVYTGQFTSDRILYSELLGKNAREVASMYTGTQLSYQEDQDTIVYMPEIDALYVGVTDEESLEEGMTVRAVYVKSPVFTMGTTQCRSIADVESLFGSSNYEGNSAVILPEAVLINALCDEGDTTFGKVDIDMEQVFTEAATVRGVDSAYEVYLYSYVYDGLAYTFICPGRSQSFAFYAIEEV